MSLDAGNGGDLGTKTYSHTENLHLTYCSVFTWWNFIFLKINYSGKFSVGNTVFCVEISGDLATETLWKSESAQRVRVRKEEDRKSWSDMITNWI